MASEDISQFFEGHHEVEECEPGDAGERENNTNTRWTRCAKNPGHADFIPIKDFSLSHLPAGFQDDDLYRLIKGIADLTVRISVKFTSLKRPKHLIGTTTPYPCYSMRGSNLMRTGTGKIWRKVEMFKDDDGKTCPCPICVKSSEPSNTWARIYVATATHVLYDDSEVVKCECAVGYDDDTGPKESLRGWCMDGPSDRSDLAYFSCVTHDLDLAEALEKTRFASDDLWVRMWMRYGNPLSTGQDLIAVQLLGDLFKLLVQHNNSPSQLASCTSAQQESPKDDKFMFVVSHPHGYFKHLSVGRWVHRQEVSSDGGTKYTYTSATCPGSSGSIIYRLGCNSSLHPHSGSNKLFNFSGIGLG